MALTTHDDGDADAVETLARAELDRVVKDLAAQREPGPASAATGSALARLVSARDAQLWASIESDGSAHE